MCQSQGQGSFWVSTKQLAFFRNLLGISLSCCLPTQMLSCNCIYCHPPVPRALEIQHCVRMPEEAAGSIAAIPHLPRPSSTESSTLQRIQTPSSVTLADSKFILHSASLMQRGRWVRCILSPLLIFPYRKSRITGANSHYSHVMLCGTVQSPISCSIQLHTVKLSHVTKGLSDPLYSPMAAYIIHGSKLQFCMPYQQRFALLSLLLFHLTNCTPFLLLRKGIFPFCSKSSFFLKPQLLQELSRLYLHCLIKTMQINYFFLFFLHRNITKRTILSGKEIAVFRVF